MIPARINAGCLPPDPGEHELILVPNQRQRLAIQDHYASTRTTPVWRTVNVQAIDVWLREVWRYGASAGIAPCSSHRVLDMAEELLLWESIIEQSLAEIPLINPEDTARIANRSYQALRQWQPPDGLDPLADFHQANVRVFRTWRDRYQSLCEEQGLISLVDLIHRLLVLPELGELVTASKIHLVNFASPPPLYAALLARLEQYCPVHPLDTLPAQAATPGARMEYPDAHDEIQACVAWIEPLLARDASAHIGIVTPQERPYREALERELANRLGSPSLPFEANSSLREAPLAHCGVVHDALSWLTLNLDQIRSEDFCRLLQSPHVMAATEEREARIKLELFIRRHKQVWSQTTDLTQLMNLQDRDYSCPQLGHALLENRTLARRLGARSLSHEWSALFTTQLDNLGWPGAGVTERERELAGQLEQLLQQLASLSATLGPVSLTEALGRLRTLCLHSSIPHSFDNRRQVSVYTLEEAAGLRFDHLWIAGFDDQHWPAATDSSPFLPHVLQRSLGIPHSNSELQFAWAQLVFDQLWRGTEQAFICSHHAVSEDQERRASAFSLDFSEAEPVPCVTGGDEPPSSDAMETVEDSVMVPLQDWETPHGGHSIITDQSCCPFRAFAAHRLDAEPLREFERGLNAMLRGSALHVALEYCFRQVTDSAELAALEDEARRRLVTASATAATEFLAQQQRELMTPRFRALEQARLEELLEGFLSLEQQRPPFTVLAREQRQQWQQGRLTLNLTLDRVDRLPDASLAVIDYKTGRYTSPSKDWLAERPQDMQLPVYFTVTSSTQQAPVSALVIAHVHADRLAYSGISDTDQVHSDLQPVASNRTFDEEWPAITARWQQLVTQLADDFIQGQARVDPIKPPLTCRYCGLHSLCRIRELQHGLLDEEDSP